MYKALRLTDSSNPTSGEIFPESVRVNEFGTAEERTFALGLDEHWKITMAVEARWISSLKLALGRIHH